MNSGVAGNHIPKIAHTAGQRRVWHVIITLVVHTHRKRRAWRANIALGKHTRSDDIARCLISWTLEFTRCWTSGVACQYSPCESTHSWTTSCVACHHGPWTANTVKQCRSWYAIIALVLHTHARHRAWHAIISLRQHIQSHDIRRSSVIMALGHHR